MSLEQERRSQGSWILVISVLILLLGLDQLTKWWARSFLLLEDHKFLGGLLELHLAENTGAFLSMGSQWDPKHRFIIFSVGVGIFLLSVLWQLRLRRPWKEEWGLILLLAGGIGNLIDRIYKNSVTDFLFMDFGFVHTGVFNVADMIIVVSVILLLLPKKEWIRNPNPQ